MDLGGYRTQNPFGWIDVENCRAFLQFSHATYLLLVEKKLLAKLRTAIGTLVLAQRACKPIV